MALSQPVWLFSLIVSRALQLSVSVKVLANGVTCKFFPGPWRTKRCSLCSLNIFRKKSGIWAWFTRHWKTDGQNSPPSRDKPGLYSYISTRLKKLKISHWFYCSLSNLANQQFIFCQKHPEQALLHNFTDLQSFNEMFILNTCRPM